MNFVFQKMCFACKNSVCFRILSTKYLKNQVYYTEIKYIALGISTAGGGKFFNNFGAYEVFTSKLCISEGFAVPIHQKCPPAAGEDFEKK